ncbi:hypothetical protein JKP88DRAFT_156953 [Tribonema minus]|uniref:HotDog ACOT-type domain-containing protein n=1 Tax=Tribonema minus TaxID=303371 RepID=A0A835ZC66_9STRA|nr:hypothetical protein JKP88DRAFT_156953 [Tribonema minus]
MRLWKPEQLAEFEADAATERQLHPKPASASAKSVTYKFSTSSFLRNSYRNPWGFIRSSRMLEDLDALAAMIAVDHCTTTSAGGELFWPVMVTASVDRITIAENAALDRDMTLRGSVKWTGGSSLQIAMRCDFARFTFVTRSRGSGRSTPVPQLVLESPVQEQEFRRVQHVMDRRRLQRTAGAGGAAAEAGEAFVRAQALLAEGELLRAMPCRAGSDAVLIRDTALSSVILCMPQERNTADRIFGGFLMSRALELAFTAAYNAFGTVPATSLVDEVEFGRPVDVGDILKLNACILSTRCYDDGRAPRASVEVLAHVLRPTEPSTRLSNRFDFTFSFPALVGARADGGGSEEAPRVKRVLPSDMNEALRVAQVSFISPLTVMS